MIKNVCQLRLSKNLANIFAGNCNYQYNIIIKIFNKKKLTDMLYLFSFFTLRNYWEYSSDNH